MSNHDDFSWPTKKKEKKEKDFLDENAQNTCYLRPILYHGLGQIILRGPEDDLHYTPAV